MPFFKKSIFVLLFSVLGISVYAQEKLNVIKLDLLELLEGDIGLSFEKVVSPNFSFQLTVLVEVNGERDWRNFLTKVNNYETIIKGFQIIPEARFYPFGKTTVPRGIYIGGYARYTNNSITSIDNGNWTFGTNQNLSRTEKVNVLSMGGMLGYQWILKNGINIDLSTVLAQAHRGTVTYHKTGLNEVSTNPIYETIGDELLAQRIGNSSNYIFHKRTTILYIRLGLGYTF